MKSEKIQTNKLRLALLNCICFAFSLREFQSSFSAGPTFLTTTIEDLLLTNRNLNHNYRLALIVLIVVAGINFWRDSVDIKKRNPSIPKFTSKIHIEAQTQTH